MAAHAIAFAPVPRRLVTLLKSLYDKWARNLPLVLADFHFQRARTNFENLQTILASTGVPAHRWHAKILKLYTKLKRRVDQTLRHLLRTIQSCTKQTIPTTADPAPRKAKPSPAATQPVTVAAPKRR